MKVEKENKNEKEKFNVSYVVVDDNNNIIIDDNDSLSDKNDDKKKMEELVNVMNQLCVLLEYNSNKETLKKVLNDKLNNIVTFQQNTINNWLNDRKFDIEENKYKELLGTLSKESTDTTAGNNQTGNQTGNPPITSDTAAPPPQGNPPQGNPPQGNPPPDDQTAPATTLGSQVAAPGDSPIAVTGGYTTESSLNSENSNNNNIVSKIYNKLMNGGNPNIDIKKNRYHLSNY